MTPLEQAHTSNTGGVPWNRATLERTRLGAAIGRDQAAWDDLAELLQHAEGGRSIPHAIADEAPANGMASMTDTQWEKVIGADAFKAIHGTIEKQVFEALTVEHFERPAWLGLSAEDLYSAVCDELTEALGEGASAMLSWTESLVLVRYAAAAKKALSDFAEDYMEVEYDVTAPSKAVDKMRAELEIRREMTARTAAANEALIRVLRALMGQDEEAAAKVSEEDLATCKRMIGGGS